MLKGYIFYFSCAQYTERLACVARIHEYIHKPFYFILNVFYENFPCAAIYTFNKVKKKFFFKYRPILKAVINRNR